MGRVKSSPEVVRWIMSIMQGVESPDTMVIEKKCFCASWGFVLSSVYNFILDIEFQSPCNVDELCL